jgi:hypothetical protein
LSYVIAAPQYLASAAGDLAGIGSTIGEANTAAAGPTLGVLPAGADEVSAAIAAMFDAHGQAYQALSAQAALFHDQFVQILNTAGSAYETAESNAVQLMANAASAPGAAASAAAGSPLQRAERAGAGFNRFTAFNANIATAQLAFGRALQTNEIGLGQGIFGTGNGSLGAPTPMGLTAGLLAWGPARIFNGAQLGGLPDAFDRQLAIDADWVGLATGAAPVQALLGIAPAPVQALASPPSGLLQQVSQAQSQVNANLVNSQVSANQALLVGAGKQTADSLFGARAPADFAGERPGR